MPARRLRFVSAFLVHLSATTLYYALYYATAAPTLLLQRLASCGCSPSSQPLPPHTPVLRLTVLPSVRFLVLPVPAAYVRGTLRALRSIYRTATAAPYLRSFCNMVRLLSNDDSTTCHRVTVRATPATYLHRTAAHGSAHLHAFGSPLRRAAVLDAASTLFTAVVLGYWFTPVLFALPTFCLRRSSFHCGCWFARRVSL